MLNNNRRRPIFNIFRVSMRIENCLRIEALLVIVISNQAGVTGDRILEFIDSGTGWTLVLRDGLHLWVKYEMILEL